MCFNGMVIYTMINANFQNVLQPALPFGYLVGDKNNNY